MKKLKKYLIFYSFLLLFIPKINASNGLINDFYTEFKYSEELLEAKETYQEKIDTLIEAINNNPQQFFGYDIVNIGSDIVSINKNDLSNDVMSFKTGKFLNGYNSIYNYGTTATFCMSVRYWTYNFNTGNFSGNTSSYMCYDVGSIEANPSENQIAYIDDYFYVDNYLNSETTYKNMLFEFVSGDVNHPLKVGNIIHLTSGNIEMGEFFDYLNPNEVEPTYEMQSEILENGNVKLNFTFNNYSEGINYSFNISNEVTGEYYGINNSFNERFPKMIPYGNNYKIIVPYDTYIYITLTKYEWDEDFQTYQREEIYTNVIDIDNVTFENNQDPYFQIEVQTKNSIRGKFKNTKNEYSCYYKDSNTNIINVLESCEEAVYHTFNFNGFVEFYIENSNNNRIYDRKINVLGEDQSMPYIVYNIEKQDFYSVITWRVENENYDLNMQYRISLNNGETFTSWTTLQSGEKNINVFENSTIIIEISNRQNNTIYDSKAINVINTITTIKTFNNTTNNFINKFKSIFVVNEKILETINTYWGQIKVSKIYLLIFIPFLVSVICAIINLIRRK